jgi:hypothetical protein
MGVRETAMNAQQCEQRAEECLCSMRTATGSTRETFLFLAQTWMQLAEQARVYEEKHGARPIEREVH